MSLEFSEEEMRTLCASGLFRGFGRSEVVAALRQLDARRQVCRDGAVVAHESESPTKMGVLLAGFLHVYDTAFRGTRHLVRIVRPGEVLGASLVGARQKNSAYSALVTAYGDGVLATFSLSEVDKCAKRGGGQIYENLSSVVREELLSTWRKIALLSCTKIEDRVLLYLQDRSRQEHSKTFAIGSTEGEFADFLGVSRSALARTLRRLAHEGRFTYRRDVFTLA